MFVAYINSFGHFTYHHLSGDYVFWSRSFRDMQLDVNESVWLVPGTFSD